MTEPIDHVPEDVIPPVSNSELQTWLDCRRRWWLTYYREMGAKETALTGALAFGIRIHNALERRRNGENPIDVYDELHNQVIFEILTREAQKGFTDAELRKKAEDERQLGHAMLEGFLAWLEETGEEEGYTVEAPEVTVIVPGPVPGVRLRGRLDERVYREIDHARLFRDWKTAANLTDGPALLPMDEQMKYYCMLEYLDSMNRTGAAPPEPAMGGLYTMLKKVKRTARATPPFYNTVEVHHNSLDRESMWLRTKKRVEEILAAREALDDGGDHRYEVYPHPTRDCKWKCPFFAVCPMFDDSKPEVAEQMLEQLYRHVDPYERYAQDERKG